MRTAPLLSTLYHKHLCHSSIKTKLSLIFSKDTIMWSRAGIPRNKILSLFNQSESLISIPALTIQICHECHWGIDRLMISDRLKEYALDNQFVIYGQSTMAISPEFTNLEFEKIVHFVRVRLSGQFLEIFLKIGKSKLEILTTAQCSTESTIWNINFCGRMNPFFFIMRSSYNSMVGLLSSWPSSWADSGSLVFH